MKRRLVLILAAIVCLMLAAGCTGSEESSTTSYIRILDKGTSDDQLWVKATNPYALKKKEFTITVDNENLWNLIETNKEYLATYAYKSLDEKATLDSIKHPAQAVGTSPLASKMRKIAWHSLSIAEQKTIVGDWEMALVTKSSWTSIPLKKFELPHSSVVRVVFKTTKDELLGPIGIYIDDATDEIVGYDARM
ncbi:hypothetical protein Back11_51750 [Paenibacillus baekrokdamisoli]|uniref:Uncharacterized protein n=1 Tax=Paenibacillus baekrokdamisoli TaxID=1712516 RepID=A0A3G9IY74_9BACL|nr:hypothetical protein [Paenibacillus baekrokdamisoli]MBB3069008.1 hypothetical protein [Paenibacillus baekrokdamisoli]BBH23830.1 hypothetical protein Back11_51750 [Paenibacillus baekrokdamisoli]